MWHFDSWLPRKCKKDIFFLPYHECRERRRRHHDDEEEVEAEAAREQDRLDVVLFQTLKIINLKLSFTILREVSPYLVPRRDPVYLHPRRVVQAVAQAAVAL